MDDGRHDRGDSAARNSASSLRLSLVTPNFNGATFIGETLKSVAAQGYPNLDYIVVDGASSDASLDVSARYRDIMAALISEPDHGHADAVNKGFAASTGEIMGWINSDDVLLPGALEFVDRVFRARPDIDWITGRASSMDERGRIGWVGPVRPWSRLRFLNGDHKWIQQESTFWRRSLWERAGGGLDLGFDLANDFDLWARFFRHAELHTVNRFLGCFRIREGQRSIAFRKRYETEAKAIVGRESRRLEQDYRRKFRALLPSPADWLRPPVAIGADHRFRICDPPIIEPEEISAGRSLKPVAPIARPEAPDRFERFKNRHAGERCFIMGNGPSLNRMDLSKLAGETVFACNSAFLLFERIGWRPKYYACVDSRVLPDRARDIDAMLRAHPDMTAFFPAVIQEHTGAKARRPSRLIVPTGANRYFFNEVSNSIDNLPRSMFSDNIDDNVVQPFTVAITMLQIAAYMGYSQIYLIGCDTDYEVTKTVREEKDKTAPGVALTSKKDDDPNHFDRRYFGKGRKWHAPRPEMMIMHYGHAKEALDAIGVATYNATVGGRLEVFPRRDFDTLFPEREKKMAASGEHQGPSLLAPRAAAGVIWRARSALLAIAGAAAALVLLSRLPAFAGSAGYFWGAAGFVILLGLIAVTALKLRGFIIDLSQQILDLSNGACRPPERAVIARIEADREIERLRAEVDALKKQLNSAAAAR